MRDILILTHIDYCPPGDLARVLDHARRDFTVLRAELGELDGFDLDRTKAMAPMGDGSLPWPITEVAVLGPFIRRDSPMIGHCLGGQLLAKALGAEVRRMPYTESGWQWLKPVEGATGSPWLSHLPDEFAIFQWHGDSFAVPEGAQPLLSSQWCANQGFAWGDKLPALQGHPEMTEELVRDWLDAWSHLLDDSQPSQQSLAQMLDDLPAKVRALNQVAAGFYRHWLSLATN